MMNTRVHFLFVLRESECLTESPLGVGASNDACETVGDGERETDRMDEVEGGTELLLWVE